MLERDLNNFKWDTRDALSSVIPYFVDSFTLHFNFESVIDNYGFDTIQDVKAYFEKSFTCDVNIDYENQSFKFVNVNKQELIEFYN